MNAYALVCLSTGKVQTFVRPDLPAGWEPPAGYQIIPDDQLPAGWEREELPPAPLSQATDTALQRLTQSEKLALFTARRTDALVDYFLTRATATGTISEADPEFASARDYLAAKTIIAAERWSDLLAS